jgi:tape measure domain-containing protein
MNTTLPPLELRITADGRPAAAEAGRVEQAVERVGQQSAAASTQSAAASTRMAAGLASAAAEAGRVGQAVNRIGQQSAAAAAQSTAAVSRIAAGFSSASSAAGQAANGTSLLSSGLQRVARAATGLVALNSLTRFAGELVDTAARFDAVNKSLETTSGSALAAGSNFEFLRATSRTLGVELLSSAKAFAHLQASAQGTALEGEQTRRIFAAIARAGSALGLSADETSGALLAIGQMMSKGTVQAEELRGQLGERLPGAFNLAARAMGVTTAELSKMLEHGQVVSADFLPKFAEELDRTYADARFDGIQNNINRITNAWEEFKRSAGHIAGIEHVIGLLAGGAERFNASLTPGSYLLNRRLDGGDRFGLSDPGARSRLLEAAPKGGLAGVTVADIRAAAQSSGPLSVRVKPAPELSLSVADSTGKKWIEQAIEAAAQKFGVPAELVKAVGMVESGLRQIDGKTGATLKSSAGALGIMQLMPDTARGLRVDPNDPAQNIEGGAKLLRELLTRFKGDTTKALAAYNWTPDKVENFGLSRLPEETAKYLEKVKKQLGDSDLAGKIIDLKEYKRNLDEAQALFTAQQASQIAAAENAGKRVAGIRATQMAGLDAWLQQGQTQRAAELIGKTGEARRKAELNNLQAEARDAEEYARRRAEIEKQAIDQAEQIARARLAAARAEQTQAAQFEVSAADRLKLDDQVKTAETELAVLAERE